MLLTFLFLWSILDEMSNSSGWLTVDNDIVEFDVYFFEKYNIVLTIVVVILVVMVVAVVVVVIVAIVVVVVSVDIDIDAVLLVVSGADEAIARKVEFIKLFDFFGFFASFLVIVDL